MSFRTGRVFKKDSANIQDIPKPPGYGWAVLNTEVQLRSDCDYLPHPNNPVQGSKYECRGVIQTLRDITDIALAPDTRPVSVDWSNGRSNQYFFEDLEPYNSSLWGEFGNLPEEKKGEDLPEEKKGKLFNKHDIVFLKPGFKTAGHKHPALGTTYQCPGTVETVKHDNIGVRLTVKWYNSLRDEYSIQYEAESILINAENREELKRFVKGNPNFAYRLNKDTQHQDNYGVFSFFRTVMDILPESVEKKLPIKDELSDFAAEYVGFDYESSDKMTKWAVIPSEERNEDPSDS